MKSDIEIVKTVFSLIIQIGIISLKLRTFFFDEDDIDPVDYTLNDDIPVRIYDGKLMLNLSGI